MRMTMLSIGAILLAACASSEKPSYMYNEISVINNSKQILRDFSIKVPATGAEFSCGNVAPLGLCSNRFGLRKYRYNPIQIGWSFGDRGLQTDEFVVPVPVSYATGVAIQGVVEISADGGRVLHSAGHRLR